MYSLSQDTMDIHRNKSETKFLKPMGIQPEGTSFKYSQINDTHSGNIDLDAWIAKLEKGIRKPLLINIYNSGMWHAGGFPYATEVTELVVECAHNYNVCNRKVEKHGRVYADFSIEGITLALNFPSGPHVCRIDLGGLEK